MGGSLNWQKSRASDGRRLGAVGRFGPATVGDSRNLPLIRPGVFDTAQPAVSAPAA